MKKIILILTALIGFCSISIAQEDKSYIYTKKKEVIYVDEIIDVTSDKKVLFYKNGLGIKKKYPFKKILYTYSGGEFYNYNVKLHLGMNYLTNILAHNDEYLLMYFETEKGVSRYRVFDKKSVFVNNKVIILDKIKAGSFNSKKHNAKIYGIFKKYFVSCPGFMKEIDSHIDNLSNYCKTMPEVKCVEDGLFEGHIKELHRKITGFGK